MPALPEKKQTSLSALPFAKAAGRMPARPFAQKGGRIACPALRESSSHPSLPFPSRKQQAGCLRSQGIRFAIGSRTATSGHTYLSGLLCYASPIIRRNL